MSSKEKTPNRKTIAKITAMKVFDVHFIDWDGTENYERYVVGTEEEAREVFEMNRPRVQISVVQEQHLVDIHENSR